MIHVDTIPQQADGYSINSDRDSFYLTHSNGVMVKINRTASLLWQLADGENTIGNISNFLHEQYPDAGYALDINLIDAFRALSYTGGIILSTPDFVTEKKGQSELCILFVYHKTDIVSRRHLDLLTFFNPFATVIPLGYHLSEIMDSPLKTIDVGQFSSRWDLSNPWRSVDGIVFTWFLNRNFSAKRYLVAEWDCHCTMPVDIAYKNVWGADLAVRRFFLQKDNPSWQWFSEISRLPSSEHAFAAGVPPFGNTLFSHRALEVLSREVTSEDVFSEFRVATTANRIKLKIQTFPERLYKTISAHFQEYDYGQQGVFHPVKHIVSYGLIQK